MEHPSPDIDPVLFRRVMARFATGVTVIAVRRADGSTKAMTANAFMSGSLEPPLCVVSIAKRAHMHLHMSEAGRFSVNVLGRGDEALSNHFAGNPVPELHVEFGEIDDVPVLNDAIARITADKVTMHDCGDHSLFIGQMLHLDGNAGEPLVYCDSQYGSFMPLQPQPADIGPFWWRSRRE